MIINVVLVLRSSDSSMAHELMVGYCGKPCLSSAVAARLLLRPTHIWRDGRRRSLSTSGSRYRRCAIGSGECVNGALGPRVMLSLVIRGLVMTYPVYYACIGMVFPALNSVTAVLDLPASAKYKAYRPA